MAKGIYCPHCGLDKTDRNFIESLNPHHAKYLPLCKTCIDSLFDEYIERTGNEEAGLWCVCAELGLPVIKRILDVALDKIDKNSTRKVSLFTLYYNALKNDGFEVDGFWQSDVMLTDFVRMDKSQFALDADGIAEQERIWGKFETKDYELLNEFYEMYTEDLPNMDVALSMRYRDLCKAELSKRKADESKDVNEIQKAQKNLNDILKLLKLDNFTDNKQSDIEKHIERMCWMVENTNPCECKDLEKYKDFSGFGIKWSEIMRCMRNLIANSRDYPEVQKGEE